MRAVFQAPDGVTTTLQNFLWQDLYVCIYVWTLSDVVSDVYSIDGKLMSIVIKILRKEKKLFKRCQIISNNLESVLKYF